MNQDGGKPFGGAARSEAWRAGGNDSVAAFQSSTPVQSGGASAPSDVTGHPFEAPEGGRYEPVAVLGEGGMGRVRLVLDRRLRREVAYKELRPGVDARRLSQEAWITAQLEHPGIVSVYDAGVGDSGLYYTMRLVRGRSLEEALAAHPGQAGLGERIKLLRHFLSACEAVAFAHKAGIVHRDIKPQNIMVGEFGETVVVDWGLARPTSVDEVDWQRAVLTRGLAAETMVGEIVGTPAYMSPEQARTGGHAVDARSDVWSLGATLYRLIAGAPPFAASDSQTVLEHVRVASVPPLERAMPEAPRELVAIAMRALARAPDDRYSDARAMAADVAAWLDGRRVSAHPYSPIELLRRVVKAWRVPLAVAAVGLMALAVVGIVAATRIVSERDRAVVAEARTRDALVGSDQNLALALLGRAEGAGQRPETELLAAHALKLSDGLSPTIAARARGVVMHLAGPRPQVVERRALPQCALRVVDAAVERVACLGDRTSVWREHEQWSLPVPSRDAVFVGERLVVASDRDLIMYDAAGLERGRASVNQPGRLSASGQRVFVMYGWGYEELAVEDARLGHLGHVRQCDPKRTLLAVLMRGEDHVVVCDDGVVMVGARALQSPVAGRAVALSHASDRLAILAETGRLALLDLASGQAQVLDTGLASGAAVAWMGEALVVLGQGEGVRVLSPRAAGVVALPRDVSGMAVGEQGLWTFGHEAQRWTIDTAPAQVIGRRGETGIASFARVGERFVLGAGEGRLESWLGGLRTASRNLGDRVVKRVALSRDGVTAYVSLIGPAILTFDAATLEAGPEIPVHGVRRIEVLADGGLLVCAFAEVCKRVLGGEVAALEGAFVGADTDVDARGERAVILEDGGQRIGVLAGAMTPSQRRAKLDIATIARPADARAIAIEDAIVVLTSAEVIVLADDGAEQLRFASERGVDIELTRALIVVGTLDNVTRVYDRSGRLLAELGGHGERVAQVLVGDDAIWSASWDGSARRYDLSALSTPGEALVVELERAWGMDLQRLLTTR